MYRNLYCQDNYLKLSLRVSYFAVFPRIDRHLGKYCCSFYHKSKLSLAYFTKHMRKFYVLYTFHVQIFKGWL